MSTMSTIARFIIRKATERDAVGLLGLMKELALFEHYLDGFDVTESELIERGLREQSNPQFTAFVATNEQGQFLAYAVVYLVPFTFDLHPDLVLKELYVKNDARGLGIGQALFAAVNAYAVAQGCKRIKWTVLPDNESAKLFYRGVGGMPDAEWEGWNKKIDQPLIEPAYKMNYLE